MKISVEKISYSKQYNIISHVLYIILLLRSNRTASIMHCNKRILWSVVWRGRHYNIVIIVTVGRKSVYMRDRHITQCVCHCVVAER